MGLFFRNRKFIISILILFLNLTFNGCFSLRETSVENNQPIKIYKIITNDDETISFENSRRGYAVLSNKIITSYEKNGKLKEYPISTVKKVYTEKFDLGKTIFASLWIGLGVMVAISLIIILTVPEGLKVG